MILVFQDDGTVMVVNTVTEANCEFESVDVEAGEYTFMDERGFILEPSVHGPSARKILGLFTIYEVGPFDLVPTLKSRDDLLEKLDLGGIPIDRRSTTIRSLATLRKAAPQLFRNEN